MARSACSAAKERISSRTSPSRIQPITNTTIISNFDPAKDVIDLSRIDANITTPGLQHFTFIGTAPFSGTGAQVRYQLNPATNQTFVEVDLAGDSGNYWPDFEIVLSGLMPLTAANFALTAAQSTTDLRMGLR